MLHLQVGTDSVVCWLVVVVVEEVALPSMEEGAGGKAKSVKRVVVVVVVVVVVDAWEGAVDLARVSIRDRFHSAVGFSKGRGSLLLVVV